MFNGISLPVQQIQLGISHLCIIRYEQEEILKITNTVHRINLLRIINANQDIAVKVSFVIIELADFRIYIYRIPTIGVIITFCPFKRVIQTEVYQIFIPHTVTDILRYVRILKEVDSYHVLFIFYAEYFQVLIIQVNQESILIIDFHSCRDIGKDTLKELLTTVQCPIGLHGLRGICKQTYHFIFFRRINYPMGIKLCLREKDILFPV